MVVAAFLSSKGQLVIPKSIRNILGIHSGSELMLKVKNNGALEVYPVKGHIKIFFGLGKTKELTNQETDEDIDKMISKAVINNDRY